MNYTLITKHGISKGLYTRPLMPMWKLVSGGVIIYVYEDLVAARVGGRANL